MGHLIDDLLAFSKKGRQDLKKNIIDTHSLVKEITSQVGGLDKPDGIEWDVEPLPSVSGDINTIRQVWINLISNAVKYSGRNDHPRISIGHFIHDGQTAFFI